MSISQLFPMAELAEDQQFPRLILYTHVVHRMVNFSAGIAVISTGARLAYRKLRPPSDPTKYAILQQSFAKSLVSASSKSLLIAPAVGVIATTLVMRNKSLIEWQDRSWRLLANNGQNLTDKWSIGGMVLGGVVGTVVSRRYKISLPKAVAGSAGLGCLAGLTCMIIFGKIVKAN
ncbi:uncharacterized protein LOC119084993 [Bradysia coprophila]|uniref:uncharacterized protein LOC119084993 n=1 Tax=Bradysia coprophila TaxID=38358 RepID=UPI00187DA105|nr:uncharacterized protein LOC119084993 [Bradysia coprophila]XP_037051057.1 uncharacterized protein LOC119084993 [Bradysia coprophila]